MRLSPFIVLVALAASCGSSTDTTGPCALSVDNLPVRTLGTANGDVTQIKQVTIVEFSDFQCPYCGMMEPAFDQLAIDYPGRVRLAYEHLPLAIHDHAYAAAVAAVCANDQGQFWPMHDLLFANQSALDNSSLTQHASTLALDLATWTTCFANGNGNVAMSSGQTAASVITSNEADASRAKITGTPTLFVDGVRSVGAVQYSTLKSLVAAAIATADESTLDAAGYYPDVVKKTGCSP